MDDSLMNLGTTASLFSSSACDFSIRVPLIDNSKGINKVSGYVNDADCPEYFALCLGQSLNSLDAIKKSSMILPASSVKAIDESCDIGLNFQLLHGDAKTSSPKSIATPDDSHIGNSLDLQLSLSIGSSESVIRGIKHFLDPIQYSLEASALVSSMPTNGEEGTSSSCWMFGGYTDTTFHNSETSGSFSSGKIGCKEYDSLDGAVDHPLTMFNTWKSPVVFTSEITHLQHNNNTKNCQFQGCVKRARGASGLCIAHGGGRRCQKLGCQKGAEGRTIFCKAHGGGHRCEHLGCTKSAEGRTDYCIAHGGGRRCIHESCSHAARGKSGLCIKHGGGKRCKKENCTKSAEGYTGLCISHGGGKRCQFPSCTKGAQGSTMFCKAHGGGKRCTFLGCTKGAEGSTLFCKGHGGGKRCLFDGGVCSKSVHGGTLFCVAHGGGKRCVAPSCTKSARGRTSYCVRHGGGKRCKYEGCGKSAQGSTDFCKAHGGGKHCAWGRLHSNVGVGDAPCDRFSRTKAGLCAPHHSLLQDECNRGENTVAVFSTCCQTSIPTEEGAVAGKGVSNWSGSDTAAPTDCRLVSLPEGRVHGGNLMAMLASSSAMMHNDG